MALAKRIVLIMILLLTLSTITLGAAVKTLILHDRIVEGVTVKGIELGNMTKEEARVRLIDLEKEIGSTTVELVYRDKVWKMTMAEAGVTVPVEGLVKKAYDQGRQGYWWDQYNNRKLIASRGEAIPFEVRINDNTVGNKVRELTKEVIIKPQNASFRITPTDQVVIIDHQMGWGPNWKQVKDDLMDISLGNEDPKINLAMEQVRPEKTADDVAQMGINGVVSQFSTRFDVTKTNRAYNVMVAAEALNDLLVKPNETISFNKIVGPRSSEAGYREAPVILNNELVPGIGGGVCQVSTTLYNGLLLGNYEIVYRRNHSLPVSYVPVGRDATVTYGGIDFKFTNNRNSYLYIKSSVKGNVLNFKLFSNLQENQRVSIIDNVNQVIKHKVVTQQDPNLVKGKTVIKQPGRNGYRTTTVRLVYNEIGQVIKREVVTKSYYKPQDEIRVMGTKKPTGPRIPIPTPKPNKPPSPPPNPAPNPVPTPDPIIPGQGETPHVEPPPVI